MRRWEPHDPEGSCLHHTIGRYRALPHHQTDRENAGAQTVMENTTAAILTGLGTMLVGAAVLVGLVWLAYRLADRS
jgi:hypothetical protein